MRNYNEMGRTEKIEMKKAFVAQCTPENFIAEMYVIKNLDAVTLAWLNGVKINYGFDSEELYIATTYDLNSVQINKKTLAFIIDKCIYEQTHFYGNKISEYGLEYGYVDYHCFAKAFDAVLNNNIMSELENKDFYFEIVSGFIDNTEEIDKLEQKIAELENTLSHECDENKIDQLENEIKDLNAEIYDLEVENGDIAYNDIYQYYIVSDFGAELIKDELKGILFYNDDLDLYVWGVTHWGTSWNYVLTDIKIK